jgi:carnitine-CoA ligase
MLDVLDPENSVVRYLLERKVGEDSDAPLFSFPDGTTWNRAQTLTVAARAANVLSGAGVQQDDRVVLLMPNGQGILKAWLGACLLGATTVPLHVAYRGEALRHALERVDGAVVVIDGDDASFADRLDAIGAAERRLNGAELDLGSNTMPQLRRTLAPWDIHNIVLTSGTTGPAKASLTSYAQSLANASWVLSDVGLGPDDTYLIDTPLYHQAAITRVVGALYTGTKLAVRIRPDLHNYWKVVKESGATSAILIGSMLAFILAQPKSPEETSHSMHTLAVSPSRIDAEELKRRFNLKRILTGYGTTEVSGPLVSNPNRPLVRDSLGRCRDGYQVRLVDEHDLPVPVGGVGELVVRTELPWLLSAGYAKDSEATIKAWRNGWFHTGDLMRCDEEGNYFFHDRNKDTMRRRGENISSFEVEREVATFPGIVDVACVAHPSDEGVDDEVKVWVVPALGARVDPHELLRHLVQRMPYFMVPRYVEVTDRLPRTPTTRVRKDELRARGNGPATWDRMTFGLDVTRHGLVKRDSPLSPGEPGHVLAE